MKSAKIGAIFLISIMALAGVGAGYAAWFDTITIQGTINTGSVDWDVIGYSGTYVWKVYDATDEIVVTDDQNYDLGAGYGFRVAYAEAMPGTNGYDVDVIFDNLFPCINFEADVTVKYTGTVPGKINAIELVNNLDVIDDYTTLVITVNEVEVPQDQMIGIQLHEGDIIHIVMIIHLPQDNTLMSLSGSFSLGIQIIQWNEYPHAFIY